MLVADYKCVKVSDYRSHVDLLAFHLDWRKGLVDKLATADSKVGAPAFVDARFFSK